MKLFITTLGIFDIKLGDNSLLKESSRSYRLYKLLQYFITFRNKKILAETIIENIWADHQSYDPQNMLRAQIFRLRQMIKSILPEGEDEKLYMSINFNNGYYSLDIGDRVTIDTEEFENLISLGDNKSIQDINSSVTYYEEALAIYKGIYLEENAYELWLVPIKNYYGSLYTKTLFKLLEILDYKEDYHKIIKICQNAIVFEPQNENIHIHLMESMLKLGQIKDAESHYEYTTFLLNKDTTSALRDINRKIQNHLIEKSETNIINIKQNLQDESGQGPLLCDFDYFKFLFNIQKRKRAIGEEPTYITLITLSEDSIIKRGELKCWGKTMTEILKSSLRQGDVYTFWNELQILILLQNVQGDGITTIENRIKDNLNSIAEDIIYDISIKSSSVMLETSLI